jgi:hypothetical protein
MHLTVASFVAFAGSTCGVLGFFTYLRAFLKKAHDHTVQATAIATAEKLAGRIDERTKQLEHNGGSSMRDDVAAIRHTVESQGVVLEAHGDMLTAFGEAIHALNGRLDNLPQAPHSTRE